MHWIKRSRVRISVVPLFFFGIASLLSPLSSIMLDRMHDAGCTMTMHTRKKKKKKDRQADQEWLRERKMVRAINLIKWSMPSME